MSSPCRLCGVSPYADCRHRPAIERPAAPPALEEMRAKPVYISGGGQYRGREKRALRERDNPNSQLNIFAELISEQHNGRWIEPGEAAVAMGLEPYRGNALMQRLRKVMGPQAK